MSDLRSCGRCIYFNLITYECAEEPKCMKEVDEAKYTSYIEGKKQGRADAIDACVKNGGCRSKCDEPYACVYGTRIFGEILALKEQKNDD